MRRNTLAVHAGRNQLGDSHVPPIDLSTTYRTADLGAATHSIDAMAQGLAPTGSAIYQRLHNPTVARFEEALAAMEGAPEAVSFASGMAASGFAATQSWNTNWLAGSALMHAYAGSTCLGGSNASTICSFLSELVKKQST